MHITYAVYHRHHHYGSIALTCIGVSSCDHVIVSEAPEQNRSVGVPDLVRILGEAVAVQVAGRGQRVQDGVLFAHSDDNEMSRNSKANELKETTTNTNTMRPSQT